MSRPLQGQRVVDREMRCRQSCGTPALGGGLIAASAEAEASFSFPAGGGWATWDRPLSMAASSETWRWRLRASGNHPQGFALRLPPVAGSGW